MNEIVADNKEKASRTFVQVAEATRNNFPEPFYRPRPNAKGRMGIVTGGHPIFGGADGTGTKPELAERLATMKHDARHYEGLAFDVTAMVADDTARAGHFVVGILNSLDVNSAADPDFIAALARGMHRACDKGRFPLLNGETAELGQRTPGFGKNHLNWNAAALEIISERKVIDGSKMKAGHVVVGLREQSIRSNGLTMARKILEQAYVRERSFENVREAVIHKIGSNLRVAVDALSIGEILDFIRSQSALLEQVLVPWHEMFPELTQQLLTPSTIYAPLIYEAQGGIDGPVKIPLLGCAHISGGGVPLKAKRMLEGSGLGIHLDAVFPDPKGISMLLELAEKHTDTGKPLIEDRKACEQWNRGVGFLCVVESDAHAHDFIQLAAQMGYEAAVMGTVIPEKSIRWRGHEWRY